MLIYISISDNTENSNYLLEGNEEMITKLRVFCHIKNLTTPPLAKTLFK